MILDLEAKYALVKQYMREDHVLLVSEEKQLSDVVYSSFVKDDYTSKKEFLLNLHDTVLKFKRVSRIEAKRIVGASQEEIDNVYIKYVGDVIVKTVKKNEQLAITPFFNLIQEVKDSKVAEKNTAIRWTQEVEATIPCYDNIARKMLGK